MPIGTHHAGFRLEGMIGGPVLHGTGNDAALGRGMTRAPMPHRGDVMTCGWWSGDGAGDATEEVIRRGACPAPS